MLTLSKRQFLKATALLPVATGCALTSTKASVDVSYSADQIKQLTALPKRNARIYSVDSFGGKAEEGFDNTQAIAAAIAACHTAGGGRVIFAAGVYETGPIHLKSGVELHVPAGTELSFSTQPEAYLPAVFTRWEGMEMMGYSPFVYAYGESDIAITGGGILNGNANNSTWWPWKGPHKDAHWDLIPGQDQKIARNALFDMAEKGVPVHERVFAKDSFLRPVFVQFYHCKRVLVEDITIRQAPFWLLHPVLSEDVTVRGVTFSSHGPNSDGCDPESCNRVVIEQCFFDTGDDCIAIKSGRNADGRRLNVASTNILIQDCQMRAGHGGVVIGSEISGGMQNLHVRRCEMNSPELERAIRIKTNASRGGVLKNLHYSDIHVGRVQDVIVINFYYEEGRNGDWLPLVDQVSIRNLRVDDAERVFMLRGFKDSPIQHVAIENMTVQRAKDLGVVEHIVGLNMHNCEVNSQPLSQEDVL